MGLTKRRMMDQQAERQRRWQAAGVDADDATLAALDEIAAAQAFEQRLQQDGARSASKATRAAQADADAQRVARFFERAYRPGMTRAALQSAAMRVMQDDDKRERDRLLLMQEAGNRPGARRCSAALDRMQRDAVLITVHRAGKWIEEHDRRRRR